MSRLDKEARLHEKVVQQIARDSLPRVQPTHTTRRRNKMAQRVSITLVDDLDGTEATETVAFSLDSNSYEIDLNEVHAKELRTAMEGFIAVARRVSGRKKAAKSKHSPADVRKWAREQGMEVSTRGAISAEVMAAYEAAH